MIDTVTCVHRPVEIDAEFEKIYGGSGRFEKYASSKVDSVEQITVLDSWDFYPLAMNPLNSYQLFPQVWYTQLDVDYVKPYFHSSML